jgi:hypothetical protein
MEPFRSVAIVFIGLSKAGSISWCRTLALDFELG